MESVEYRELFVEIFRQYSLRVVQQEPPTRRDWKEKPRGCGCPECGMLDKFLLSPTDRTGRLAVNGQKREHFEECLGIRSGRNIQGNAAFTSFTDRTGSPFTLVVNKTNREYERTHKQWLDRRQRATGLFIGAAGSREDLKALLGDSFEQVMSFKEVTLPIAGSSIPSTVHVPEAADIEALLKLAEPDRSFQWLRMCFAPDPSSAVRQSDLWKPYSDTFNHVRSTHPLLELHELCDLACMAVPGAMKAQVDSV